VPVPSLTCPLCPSPLPVLADAMGGCFSKPKPGDRPPSPCPVPWGEVGQRPWTLAGGMLILGSHREDYRHINPPKFLGALAPRQGAVPGLQRCQGAVGGRAESSAHTLQTHPNTRCQLFPVPSPCTPPPSQLLPSYCPWGQNCPPRAPR